MTTFLNHAPINFDAAEEIAEYSTDGGVYHDIGHFFVRINKGKLFHVWSSHNSGCDYGSGTTTTRKYLFGCRTREELTSWLLEQLKNEERITWANELLVSLGYDGEEA